MTKNYIYSLVFIVTAFSACSKITIDTPANLVSSRSVISTTTTTSATTTPGTISYDIKDQVVKVGLANKTLTMNYYEDITLVIKKDSLQTSWSIIFNEDFKGTQVAGFSYTTVGKTGNITTNYAEPNLNNVAIRSTRDTSINSVTFTKISFNRTFTFTSTYGTSTAAGAEYDYLLNNKETLGFSAYITSASGRSTTYTTRANLVYSSN